VARSVTTSPHDWSLPAFTTRATSCSKDGDVGQSEVTGVLGERDALVRTQSCSSSADDDRRGGLSLGKRSTSPGPASTPPSSCGRLPLWDRYPTTTPPQPSGGASLISYRKRRTRTQRPTRQSERLGTRPRGHCSGSDPGHARRRHPRSVRAAENVDASQCRRSDSRSLLPNPSTGRGRLVRGGAWHFLRCRGDDTSVKAGWAREVQRTFGECL
jgi:hypothetical protein